MQFGRQVVKGDLLLIAATQFERPVAKVEDNEHDPFTLVDAAIANGQDSQDYVELYYAQDAKGGPTTVTVTFGPATGAASDGGDTNVGIYEFSSLSATSPLDDAAPNSSSGQLSETIAVRSLRSTAAYEVCFAVGVDSGPQNDPPQGNDTIMPGSGFSFPPDNAGGQTDRQIDGINHERYYTEYAIVTAGGCKPNFLIAYPSFWAIIGATFKP